LIQITSERAYDLPMSDCDYMYYASV